MNAPSTAKPRGNTRYLTWQIRGPGGSASRFAPGTGDWIDNAGLVAGVAFYGFLAMVPLLAVIVLSTVSSRAETVLRNMQAMMAVLPTDVAVLIGEQLMTAARPPRAARAWRSSPRLVVALYGGTNAASAISWRSTSPSGEGEANLLQSTSWR
jgi:membrane protein